MTLDLIKERLDLELEKARGHFQIIRECIG
jgi:hypothetical protein